MENDEAIKTYFAFCMHHGECKSRVKKHEEMKEKSFRVIVKREVTKDKFLHENIFEVDEALDG